MRLQRHRARDQVLQLLRQLLDHVVRAGIGGGELDLGLFAVGLGQRHLAFLHRAVQQQPRGELHQAGGQPHAFGGVGEADGTIERLGLGAAGAVEIGRGLLDQIHAFAEQGAERRGIGEPLAELNESAVSPCERSDMVNASRHWLRRPAQCAPAYDEQIIARPRTRVQPQGLIWFPAWSRKTSRNQTQKRAAVSGGF